MGGQDPIGISTTLQLCRNTESWMFDDKSITPNDRTFGYYCGGLVGNRGENSSDVAELSDQDVLTVRVDCDEWRVSFLINGELMDEAVTIPQNRTYYLLMSLQG